MNHSIKPFLLQSILLWAEANHCTPLLIVKPDASHTVPDEVMEVERALFNISLKAVERRELSTHGISFVTYLNTSTEAVPIELGIDGWIGVKIKESGVVFDLSFYEQIGDAFNPWPYGMMLVAMEEQLEENYVEPKKRSHLRLVVDNDASGSLGSSAPQEAPSHLTNQLDASLDVGQPPFLRAADASAKVHRFPSALDENSI